MPPRPDHSRQVPSSARGQCPIEARMGGWGTPSLKAASAIHALPRYAWSRPSAAVARRRRSLLLAIRCASRCKTKTAIRSSARSSRWWSAAMTDLPILHGYWRSSAAYRVRIALSLKGIPSRSAFVHLRQGEQRSATHRALNPAGLVPVWEEPNGICLSQSLAIIEYLDELYPEPPL